MARLGPCYGYYLNNIDVTSSGRPYLGAALGTASYTDHFVAEKIAQWVGEVSLLSAIAITQPPCCLCSLHPWAVEQVVLLIPHSTKPEQPLPTPGECYKNRIHPYADWKPPS